MTKAEMGTQPRLSFVLNWTTMLSLIAAVVASGTATLHLIGDVRHRSFLQYWDVDPGLFPKPTDWILINGYYGVVDRFISVGVALLSNLHWLALAAVILGLYIFVLLSPLNGVPGVPSQWLLRQPEWARRLLRQMVLTALFVTVAPLALIMLTAFMAVPAALGELAGKSAAESASAEFTKGCGTSRTFCTELKKNGETVATGFLLDSSSSHIAIFDVQMQRSRVLPLEGLEVISGRVTKLDVNRTLEKPIASK